MSGSVASAAPFGFLATNAATALSSLSTTSVMRRIVLLRVDEHRCHEEC
jgi:hypothetical protein